MKVQFDEYMKSSDEESDLHPNIYSFRCTFWKISGIYVLRFKNKIVGNSRYKTIKDTKAIPECKLTSMKKLFYSQDIMQNNFVITANETSTSSSISLDIILPLPSIMKFFFSKTRITNPFTLILNWLQPLLADFGSLRSYGRGRIRQARSLCGKGSSFIFDNPLSAAFTGKYPRSKIGCTKHPATLLFYNTLILLLFFFLSSFSTLLCSYLYTSLILPAPYFITPST